MEIYVAVLDRADGKMSVIIGAFSTEDLARMACQDEENDIAETTGQPSVQLTWKQDAAGTPDGDTYTVMLVNLDER